MTLFVEADQPKTPKRNWPPAQLKRSVIPSPLTSPAHIWVESQPEGAEMLLLGPFSRDMTPFVYLKTAKWNCPPLTLTRSAIPSPLRSLTRARVGSQRVGCWTALTL